MKIVQKLTMALSLAVAMTAGFSVTQQTKAETESSRLSFGNHQDLTTLESAATLTPKATITPSNGTVAYKKNVKVDFKVTDPNNTSYVGKKIDIGLIISDKPDFVDDSTSTYLFYDYSTPVTLTSKTPSTSYTFKDVPLIFKGTNYLSCVIYDYTTGKSTVCGGNSTPYVVKVSYTGNIVPVYRFYSSKNVAHFYTANAAEAAYIDNNYPEDVWSYEGIAFYASSANSKGNCDGTGKSAVYRFFNASVSHHFFTINAAEKDALVKNNPAWKLEGVSYCANTKKVTGTTELYRFFNPTSVAHFYTINAAEKDALIKGNPNWKYENVAYYVSK